MTRLVSPALDQLSSLRTPLTKGEKKVLEIFLKKLSEKWEIYIQPHLNGLRPDFVLLNPDVGIGIFEVKDWNLDAMPYRVEYDQHQLPQLWATNREGKDFCVSDNPITKISLYKDEIINLYCPLIDIKSIQDPRNLAVITAGVIMTEASQHQIETLFNPFRKQNGMFGKSGSYYPLAGRETLETEDILAIFPGAKWNSSKYMTAELANDLRSWLVEPDFAYTQRQPLELNKEQKNLINSRTKTGYRRIKGSAGSGKSLVLAGRAAQLSSENKDVLVICFNITLWHYLRDLAVRHQIPNTKINTVTWLHFHQWCKRVCYQAGDEYIRAYGQLWQGLDRINNKEEYEKILQQILEHDLPDLVNQVIDRKFDTVTTYDAILVDEGQDYNPKWWNLLRKICREDGEMILLADQTQDLYDRASYWTDESMEGLDTGFTGRWSTLDFCYRTPNVLIPYLQKFAKTFLPTITINLPEQDQEELNVFPVKMRWLQVNSQDSVNIFTEEILKMPLWTNPDQLSFSDTVFLVQDHKTGLKCVNLLEHKNIKVAHVFGENHQQQKKRKMGFFMGDARVKGATIHSFKGWESCCVVININRADTETELAAIYVAISRLKRRQEGSYITVVCSAPELREFGSTWENFETLN